MTICTSALQVFTPMKKKAWAFENSAIFFIFKIWNRMKKKHEKKNSKGTKKRGKKNEDCK